jgi:DNA-binding beta-propeller fold protein YncE
MALLKTLTRRATLAAASILLVAGCASQPKTAVTDSHVYYPEPPAPPRIQFLTSFSDGQHWVSQSKSSFAEWVVGEDTKAKTSTGFESPYGVAIHNKKLYICDVALNKVHIVDLATRAYSVLGPADRIRNPVNLTIDADGTKYLCDTSVRKILVFDPNDRLITEIGETTSWMPIDCAIKGDELYITDTTGGKVEVYSKQGRHLRTISEKGMGPDQLTNPTNLEVGPDGRLYVVDTFLQIVKVFNPADGAFVGSIGGPGANIGSFARPKGIAIDSSGAVYVTDAQWDVVQIFNPDGQLLATFGAPGKFPYSLGLPAGIIIDKTTVDIFEPYLAKDFKPEYLLFVVNQFGKHKIGVFAFGKNTSLPASAYQIDTEAVQKRQAELRKQAEQEKANPIKDPVFDRQPAR